MIELVAPSSLLEAKLTAEGANKDNYDICWRKKSRLSLEQ